MKLPYTAPVQLTLLASLQFIAVRAHWTYSTLIVNNTIVGAPYQYIRRSNNSNSPLQDVYSTDMRCNSGGASGRNTSTYTVRAGDSVGFGIATTFGHPGPQQVYLSRAPPGVPAAEYDGAGDWFKIYAATYALSSTTTNATTTTTGAPSPPGPSIGPNGLVWSTHNIHNFVFPLPAGTPPGEYLLRAEGLALHAAHKLDCAQFYVGCAQIRVVDVGRGGDDHSSRGAESGAAAAPPPLPPPGPLVRIPGVYNDTEPGVLIPDFWTKIRDYAVPGPPLWPEGTEIRHVVEQLPGVASKVEGS